MTSHTNVTMDGLDTNVGGRDLRIRNAIDNEKSKDCTSVSAVVATT